MDPNSFYGQSQQAFAGPSNGGTGHFQPQQGGMSEQSIAPELLQWHQQQSQQQQQHQQQQQPYQLQGLGQGHIPDPYQQQPFNAQSWQLNSNAAFQNPPLQGQQSHSDTQGQMSQSDPFGGPASMDPSAPSAGEDSKTGPIRSKAPKEEDGASPGSPSAAGSGKSNGAKNAPVRAACLFCRARKSRCNGKQPCHNCINRGREDDCIYTVSRRGGKPKPRPNQSQEEANLEQHLKRLFQLSQVPQQVRIPGVMPQLLESQREQQSMSQQQQSMSPLGGGSAMPPGLSGASPMADFSASMAPSGSTAALPWQQMAAMYAAMGQQPGLAAGQSPPFPMPPNPSMMGSSQVSNGNPAGPSLSSPNQAQGNEMSMMSGLQNSQAPMVRWDNTPSGASGSPANNQRPTSMSALPSTPASANQTALPQNDVYNILLSYYRSLYRFIPVFMPPEYIDVMSRRLSMDSPFILSLQAIMPLLHNTEAEGDGSDSSGVSQSKESAHGPTLGFGASERRKQLLELTSYYERRASEAIESVLERAESHMARGMGDTVDGQGSTLGVIQALAVLCVYHYGNGRALKARLKADQAMGLCMAKGLHRLPKPKGRDDSKRQGEDGPSTGTQSNKSSFVKLDNDPFGSQSLFMDMPSDVCYEMKKRIWWTCWSSSLWCAYNTAIVPTIRADDPRVKTDLPASIDPQAWTDNIQSLQLLLLIQERVLALSNNKDLDTAAGSTAEATASNYAGSAISERQNTPYSEGIKFTSLPPDASRQDILDSMLEIDRSLQERIGQIESDEDAFQRLCQGGTERLDGALADDQSVDIPTLSRTLDQDLAAFLRRSAAVQIYTSSLTLHLGQAFQGATLFERKLCFLNTVSDSDSGAAACQVPVPDSFSSTFGHGAADTAAAAIVKNSNDFAATSNDEGQSSTGPLLQQSQPTHSSQELFARGPFLPKHSLSRCVHASKRLLEIARRGPSTKDHQGKQQASASTETTVRRREPNPFNACSFVLISFTLLMQALAVSSGSRDAAEDSNANSEDEDDGETGDGTQVDSNDFNMDPFVSVGNDGSGAPTSSHPSRAASVDAFSRGLMQSAQKAAALGGAHNGGTEPSNNPMDTSKDGNDGNDSSDQPIIQGRHLKLFEIWSRVSEAHATLKDLSRYWKMVEPMADEVELCLETSQLLLMQ